MKQIVPQIHRQLIRKSKTIAVAESCTGGLISTLLTQDPGSSKYFIFGIVAYSNAAKIKILKIPASVIANKGAVSAETARRMAKSARSISKADLGVAVTGIAGPAGGSKEKPVGTVFIAIDAKNKKICKRFKLTGSRYIIRKETALKTLELLKPLV